MLSAISQAQKGTYCIGTSGKEAEGKRADARGWRKVRIGGVIQQKVQLHKMKFQNSIVSGSWIILCYRARA